MLSARDQRLLAHATERVRRNASKIEPNYNAATQQETNQMDNIRTLPGAMSREIIHNYPHLSSNEAYIIGDNMNDSHGAHEDTVKRKNAPTKATLHFDERRDAFEDAVRAEMDLIRAKSTENPQNSFKRASSAPISNNHTGLVNPNKIVQASRPMTSNRQNYPYITNNYSIGVVPGLSNKGYTNPVTTSKSSITRNDSLEDKRRAMIKASNYKAELDHQIELKKMHNNRGINSDARNAYIHYQIK